MANFAVIQLEKYKHLFNTYSGRELKDFAETMEKVAQPDTYTLVLLGDKVVCGIVSTEAIKKSLKETIKERLDSDPSLVNKIVEALSNNP
jgi:hypothetical protein